MGEIKNPNDKTNSVGNPPPEEKNLEQMRHRNIDMFTSSGGQPTSDRTAEKAAERLEAIRRQLKPSDSDDSTTPGKSDSTSEQPRDVSNPYKIAFLGASPDAVYGSADPNTSIVIDQRLEKIERDGDLWKITYENRNGKHTFWAKEVFLGSEAKGNQVARKVKIVEMFKAGIVDSESFIQAHNNLSEKERAILRTLISKGHTRIIFSGERGAEGANFHAQGDGYGVTLTGISEEEEKGLYRYMPYSLAKVAAVGILKKQYVGKPIPQEYRDAINQLDPTMRVEAPAKTAAVGILKDQYAGKIPQEYRDAINQLDPTMRVEVAENMRARELLSEYIPRNVIDNLEKEAAENMRARELLSEYIPRNVIADLEKGPIDLDYGLPPGGKVYNSSLKSADISPEGGVTVTLQDGQAIKGRLLVLGKKNSAIDVLEEQDQKGLKIYFRDGNVVGVQTTDGSMKILDTTPDPRLPPHINEILLDPVKPRPKL